MKMTIWQNVDINIDDWKDDFLMEKESNGTLADYLINHDYTVNDDDVYDWACDTNNMYLDDEHTNLNVKTNGIIAIADLGLWYGRRQAYREVGDNIKDCLYTDCDYVDWYCEDGDFRMKGIHHDGTNHIVYREWKDGVDKDELEELLYYGKCTQADIDKYTVSLVPRIAKVYGWAGY